MELDADNVLVEVSYRHIHLSKEHLDILFGDSYNLKIRKFLSQPGQYAAEETLNLKYGNKEIREVRILGPVREKTQVEISYTESLYLKINAPYRLSGDINGSPGIILIGKNNFVKIKEGVIIAKPHLHISYEDANKIGVKNGQVISIYVKSNRPRTFHDVIVRADYSDKVGLAVHLDSDEGNSACISGFAYGKILNQKIWDAPKQLHHL